MTWGFHGELLHSSALCFFHSMLAECSALLSDVVTFLISSGKSFSKVAGSVITHVCPDEVM